MRVIYIPTINPSYMKTVFSLFLTVMSLFAAAQPRTVCSTAEIPPGWVAVSTGPACPGANSPLSFNIQKVDTLPSGSTIQSCGFGRLPDGWVTVGWGPECGRGGGANTVVYSRTIEKVQGLPTGTELIVCSSDSLPTGWAVVTAGGSTCGSLGGSTFRSRTIRKQ